MGKIKKNTTNKLMKITEKKSPIKTRSTTKLIHSFKQKEIASIPVRITRLKKEKPKVKIQQNRPTVELTNRLVNKVNFDKVKIVEAKEIVSIPARVTRSKEKKSNGNIQQIAPAVESTKRLVKRVDFVKVKTFKENDIILAKQKYSSPWPARILNIQEDKVTVFFFGDKRTGTVSSFELYDFIKSIDALKSFLALKKPRGYITGIREVEALLKIPHTHSVFNTI